MTNDEQTRAAIESFANEVSESLPNYATQQEMEIARRGFQRGIAFRDKKLAETAGQFDREQCILWLISLGIESSQFRNDLLPYLEKQHDRTAAAFTARIEELEIALKVQKLKCESVFDERDEALAKVKQFEGMDERRKALELAYRALEHKFELHEEGTDKIVEANKSIMKDLNEALAKVAEATEKNITWQQAHFGLLKSRTKTEMDLNAALARIKDLRAALKAKHSWDCGAEDPADDIDCDCIMVKALAADNAAQAKGMK